MFKKGEMGKLGKERDAEENMKGLRAGKKRKKAKRKMKGRG